MRAMKGFSQRAYGRMVRKLGRGLGTVKNGEWESERTGISTGAGADSGAVDRARRATGGSRFSVRASVPAAYRDGNRIPWWK